MTRSHMQMLTSVSQALALGVLASIISHYTWHHTMTKINHYEFFADPEYYNPTPDVNLTALREAAVAAEGRDATNLTAASNGTKVLLHNATFTVNDTLHTFGTMWGDNVKEESFWLKSLPKEMFPLLFIITLDYYWMLWLERILPGRRRGEVVASSSSAPSPAVMVEEMDMEDDTVEEEIVKRWIAKGKVQRSSLSWLNTFLKWAMDQSLGTTWRVLVWRIIDAAVIDRQSMKTFREEFWLRFFVNFTANTFSVNSLGTFASFILVPAYKRVVFISLGDLAWTTFFQAGLNLTVPWLMRQNWVTEMIHNINEANRNASLAEAAKNKTIEVSWDFRTEL